MTLKERIIELVEKVREDWQSYIFVSEAVVCIVMLNIMLFTGNMLSAVGYGLLLLALGALYVYMWYQVFKAIGEFIGRLIAVMLFGYHPDREV